MGGKMFFVALVLAVISFSSFIWSKAQINSKLVKHYRQRQEQAEKDKKVIERLEAYRKRFKDPELDKLGKEFEERWKKIEEEDRKN